MASTQNEHEHASSDASSSPSNTNVVEPSRTIVSGIGMWNQWTRNFKTPILALLDLMDNAFDAVGSSNNQQEDDEFHGCVYVSPDKDDMDNVTGITILNNSRHQIKPMSQVMQVYKSEKGNASESIGENGVGLKQGCATLADLSLVFSKNWGQYSLGLVAKSLQRHDGCVLPSHVFENFPTPATIQQVVTQREAECIAEYGDGSLEDGLERIVSHYKQMVSLDDRRHVFLVVLHNLKHNNSSNTIAASQQQNDDEEVDSSDDERQATIHLDYAHNAVQLMDKLKQELPRQYIHVSSDLNVKVSGDRIVFSYWQRRMVELSSFEIKIDAKNSILASQDWKNPENGYRLKIYCGFDPLRLHKSNKSPASLFVYCRQMGRLILHAPDCRNMLGLNASGTDFSQGLTIIVDDYHGQLPLNPTKQDLAFGEQAHGEVHQANLFNWLAAIAKFYWSFHRGKMVDKQKTLLTAEVKRHYQTVLQLQEQSTTTSNIPKPLPECDLSTIINIPWSLRQEKIICNVKTFGNTSYTYVTGVDTLITIREPQARQQSAEKKKRSQPERKKPKVSPSPITEVEESVAAAVASLAVIGKRKAVTGKRKAVTGKRKAVTAGDETQDEHDKDETEELLEVQDEEIRRLEQENEKLRASKDELKKEFRKLLKRAQDLRDENKSLKEEHRSRRTASKSTLGSLPASSVHNTSALQQELASSKSRIQQLEKDLKAARDRAEDAKNELEFQQETANDYRKRAAKLQRELNHALEGDD